MHYYYLKIDRLIGEVCLQVLTAAIFRMESATGSVSKSDEEWLTMNKAALAENKEKIQQILDRAQNLVR